MTTIILLIAGFAAAILLAYVCLAAYIYMGERDLTPKQAQKLLANKYNT